MAHLSLSLLGSLEVTLGGQPITGFKSNKERALLAYLAVEADRSHRREVLAGLLWPDWPDRDALNNLRYTLSDLRRVIGDHQAEPPFLLITRDTLQFNLASDHSLDVATFAQRLADSQSPSQPSAISYPPSAIGHLQSAVSLYRGKFLEGFSVSDSAGFEEWVVFMQERLARQMLAALHQLAAIHEQYGEYEQAQSWAWRQIELEPLDETAHQQLMRAMALGGQRSAALAQYEACRRLLAEELGVEPSAETTRLNEQIRDGSLQALSSSPVPALELAVRLPPFLQEATPPVETSVFVARERELAQLNGYLKLALAGQGRVVFVAGEAGSGKTTLVQEFTRRTQDVHLDLRVASGNCNAYTGVGDPYLPFREILELLTGGVQAQWAAGVMSKEHAQRLWRIFPVAVQALVEVGPDLIDTFVPRGALRERVAKYAPHRTDWLACLDRAVGRGLTTVPGALGLQQSDLFEQYTRVLQAIVQQGGPPVLLVLDDMQWADLGSISLLFHLGRRLAGSRILIVGAYRSEEVALGRDGARHPLQPVINEFQRVYGHSTVDLGQVESREFIDAFLDSEPNRLGVAFREMLYRQTGGHPLFTIELLRGLQERGDLVRDPEGKWVVGPALDWETLPARVEAVIAERIGRLDEPLQAALQVASVEGEIFTAEVVARVRATGERDLLRRLSDELDRRHHLVRAQSIQRVDGQLLSCYRFRHILFQRYLYGSLDQVEQVHLHEQVGIALEALYGAQEHVTTIAVPLAAHFEKARIAEKAIRYLQLAGERAVQLSAYREAIAHLTRGLALLITLPDSTERAEQELALQLTLAVAWMGPAGYGPEVAAACSRARELCWQLGDTSQLCRVVGYLSVGHYIRAEYRQARELAEEALSLGQRAQEPPFVALSHWQLGFILFGLGEYTQAHSHFDQVIAFCGSQQPRRLFLDLNPSDPGASALAYDASCLWCLGYPDQALSRSQEALALARALGNPFTLADVLTYGGCMFHSMRRDAQPLKEDAEQLMEVSKRQSLGGWFMTGIRHRGEALAMMGQIEEGVALMREGIAGDRALAVRVHLLGTTVHLAQALGNAGQPEQGLTLLAETLASVEQTDERHWEAELYRLRGELLLVQGAKAEAEASLHKAIQVTRRQQAKSWELRATISLSRLWQAQGRGTEAHRMLSEIYGWFTEGFDTPDLREARDLLEELSPSA